jgi:DNA repair photolyase
MSDYFIGDWEGQARSVKRAMVSLGPLSPKRYCTYACTFCYVDGAFQRYPSRTPNEVLEWLKQRRSQFNIIFISGDTDSFSKPRTSDGLDLLEMISSLNVDILFTTRYAFNAPEINRIKRISTIQSANNRILLACSSVLSTRRLTYEPRPVPEPAERLRSLGALADVGAIPILALRPLIPAITPTDIVQLLDQLPPTVRIVLSGWLYYSQKQASLLRIPEASHAIVDLYFDIAKNVASEYRNEKIMRILERECGQRNLSLYTRSAPMIEDIRSHRAAPQER